MANFLDIVNSLKAIHFYDVILPFLLVYAITYGILRKSQIFSYKDSDEVKSQNDINATVALVFGLVIVGSIQTVTIIQSIIMQASILLIFILVFLLALGFTFGDTFEKLFKDNDNKVNYKLIYGVSIVIALIMLFIIVDSFIGFENIRIGSGRVRQAVVDVFPDLMIVAIFVGLLVLFTKK